MLESTAHLTQIVKDGKATHVVVPAEEYSKLVEAATERAMDKAEEAVNDPDAIGYDGQMVLDAMHDPKKMAALRKLMVKRNAQRTASKLARARKAKGLSQRELGQRLGVPQSQISRIEKNPDRSSLGTHRKIATALGVDLRQLV